MKGSGPLVLRVVSPDLMLVEFVVAFHDSASPGMVCVGPAEAR